MGGVEQIDLFSYTMPKFKIDKPIRLIELFAGIGSQAKALKNLGANFEHWKVIEWDRFAVASYNAIHGTEFTTKDISLTHAADLEITDREKYTYIMTYSFPCQDLSLAGKQRGMSKGDNTRSGLLWEVERILDECGENLPQVLLMENVPQVIGKNNIADFQEWRRKLEKLGYTNHIQILNSKNYGIPQNRARAFMVSLLGEYHYTFPKPIELKLRLKDMLEDNADEKYYLSDKIIEGFIRHTEKHNGGFELKPLSRNDPIGHTITSGYYKIRPTDNFIGEKNCGYIENGTGQHQSNQIFDTDGLARTLQSGLEAKNPLKILEDDVSNGVHGGEVL